ncbi:hypothetical protein [Virgisporangium aliadipatigenens]|nr:hypothetical protein [Virgisporangium aliadipatigenens]
MVRTYRYVGPPDVHAVAANVTVLREAGDLDGVAGEEAFTFVVDLDGLLRIAPRRSEHVACAGGRDVRAAGEVAFGRGAGGWTVTYASNQSTGYCPDLPSWHALADALDRAGIGRPDGFTEPFVFRRCPACGALNVVREEVYVCALCDADLPRRWNVD